MITNISKIKNIGCFSKYESNGIKPFDKVNILFGNNGSGKTTLSNILYLLSKHCKDKTELYDELIDNSSALEILVGSSKITNKNITKSDLDIYVFNSKFVSDSVYDGTTANIDSFNKEVKLTNPSIKALDDRLDVLNKRKEKLENWNVVIQDRLDGIWLPLNEEFQSKVSNARLTGAKPTIETFIKGDLLREKSALSKLFWNYDNIQKQSGTISRLETFKEKALALQQINIDITKIRQSLKVSLSSNTKEKLSDKIGTLQSAIDKKNLGNSIGDLTDWLKKGGRLLYVSKEVDSHCPLCNSNLDSSIDSILEEYSNYFNKSILSLFNLLDTSISSLNNLLVSSFTANNVTSSNDIVETTELYDIKISALNYNEQEKLLNGIKELLADLKQKKQSPNDKVIINESVIDLITTYNSEINTFKQNAVKAIDAEIIELKKKSIDKVVKDIKNKIKAIASIELNDSKRTIISKTKKNNSAIAISTNNIISKLATEISKLQVKRSGEVAKLNAESKYMNIYLNYLGISHFSVNKVKDKSHDNILITYHNTGKKKSKLSHALSEGEKTALAFAYFISKLRVEKIEGSENGFRDCIIVIDDPISSLDDNRMFQTANLIDSFLFFNQLNIDNYPKQLFLFSHSLVFVKYLHNALRSNSELKDNLNEYLISYNEPFIGNLPSGLKNFTNTYIVKLKEIIDFKENQISYDNVKNYLPNYMRIVLETFLAFKLALVKDSDGKLPGLSHLIKAMLKELDGYEDREIGGIDKNGAIKRLNHLKKIADHESHGNMHKAEEFSFISEKELKEFSKHTIQVLGYIDSFHFKRIKAHG